MAHPTKDIDLAGEVVGQSGTALRAILESASTIKVDNGLEFMILLVLRQ